MAIIYTYPKLTNPLGNELIVVSDVNNKNSTRLITIADIASLVPGGEGCGASIVNITDSEGTPIYTPPACSPMILTSSDASVGITGIPGGIDLSASGVVPNITFSTTAGPNEPADPFLTVDVNGTPQNVSVRGTNGVEVIRVSDSIISIGTKCATTDERGGIIIGNVDELATPVTGTGTPIWVEVNSNCEAFVRVPSAEPYILPCAEPTVLGGIKAPKVTLAAPPEIPAEGTYYSIETITETLSQQDECRAVVKIPDQTPVQTEALIEQVYNSTGNPILKGTPLHINGTGPGPELNPSVDIANATDPALMPVSGLAAEDIAIGANGPMIISGLLRDVTTNTISGVTGAGDVLYASTVVGASTPWLTGVQPSTESNFVQNVGIVSKYAGAGVGSIQVSAIGRTNATPNLNEGSIFLGNATNYSSELSIGAANTVLTSNGTTASWSPLPANNDETGWSPMTITNSATTLPVQEAGPLTLFFHATADATLNINSIKMMLTDVDGAGNANKDAEFSVALYSGSLTDVANGGPAPTLIGSWSYTPGGVAVYGIKKVFNAVATSVTAGNDYIIGVSVTANGAQLLGDGVIYGGNGSLFMANQYLCVGNNIEYGTTLGAEWPTNDIPDTSFTSAWRYAIHFYEGGEEAVVE
jgi:hypothetical protein